MNRSPRQSTRPEPSAPRQQAAIGAAAAAWLSVLLLLGLVLVLTRLNHLPPRRYIEEYILALVLGTLSFATMGALIIARRPENRIGWLLSACAIVLAFMGCIQQFTRYSLVTLHGQLPGGLLLGWINIWSWIPGITLILFYLPLLFPTGQLPTPRWKPVIWIMVVGTLCVTFTSMISPGPVDASLPEIHNPFSPAWAILVLPWLSPLGLGLMFVSLVLAVAAPVMRLRRASGVERRTEREQIKWFAYGAGIMILCFLLPILVFFPNFTSETWLSGLLLSIGFPALPAAVGIAILRYRLYEIDFLIRRTLVYTILTLLLALVYFGSVLVLQQALVAVTGRAGPLAVVVSTLLIAGLFSPLRARLQRVIDRLFFRQKYDPNRVLAEFSAAAATEVNLERLSGLLLESVEQNIQPESVSLWLIKDLRT